MLPALYGYSPSIVTRLDLADIEALLCGGIPAMFRCRQGANNSKIETTAATDGSQVEIAICAQWAIWTSGFNIAFNFVARDCWQAELIVL